MRQSGNVLRSFNRPVESHNEIEHPELTHQSSVSIVASELSNFKKEAEEEEN